MTWTIITWDEGTEIASVAFPAHWPPLSPEMVAQQSPDAILVAVRKSDGDMLVGARCSLWWRETPSLDGASVGTIGHYAASDDAAAAALLHAASERLREEDCEVAVGPMDGNTWRAYRFVTDPGSEPPFLMEPVNPPEWPRQFQDAQFAPLAQYMSNVNNDLSVRDSRASELTQRFAERGVTIRTLRPTEFEQELRRIYFVAERAFRDNFMYAHVPLDQFAAQYRAAESAVVPALVLMAEHEGQPVGFCFSIPDLLEQARTGKARTVILKTVAVLPERKLYGGLGALMIDMTHATARDLGFSRVIHALMHDTNQSRNISRATSTEMRRYALFSRSLM
jgi:hypothetical protein